MVLTWPLFDAIVYVECSKQENGEDHRRKHSRHRKIAAVVLFKLCISENER